MFIFAFDINVLKIFGGYSSSFSICAHALLNPPVFLPVHVEKAGADTNKYENIGAL